MPVTLTHPGVYIHELPSGGRTITIFGMGYRPARLFLLASLKEK